MLRDSPQIPFFIKPVTGLVVGKFENMFFNPNFKTTWSFLESQISTSPDGGEFLCGKALTGADVLMSFPLIAAKSKGMFTKATHPNLYAYVERLEAQERYQSSIKKAEELTGEKFVVF